MQHRFLATSAAALLFATGSLAAVAATGPAASAAPASVQIVGGDKAPSTPWEVQLVFTQGDGTYGCTGEQINDSWVLTANHCVDGTTAMNVYHSNDTADRGTASTVDEFESSPTGDVALVHLSSEYNLDSYPSLNLDYTAKSSGTGTVSGYGLRADSAESDGLYEASVSLTGASTDAYNGDAQHITGVSGASNHGDSGGPLVVDGEIVGVCSTGDTADPGSDTHASSNYALLSQTSSWISSTAGV